MRISALKIETILAARNMTKAALASSAGMCRQNVSAIIQRGTCEPRTAGKLAKALGIDVAEIIEKED